MRQELIDKFNDWKNDDNRMGRRIVRQSNSPFINGEYIISISEVYNLTVYNKTKNILVEKKFLTATQSENEYNPDGDLIRFEQIARIFSIEFFQKYTDALTELFLKYEGEFTEVE